MKKAYDWICTRRFVADARGKRRFATAKIGRPEKRGKDWACALFISNIGMEAPLAVYGVDPMQTVILALEAARVRVLVSKHSWRWVYGETGDTGIPCTVPMSFGREFAARLESMIDAEVEKFVPVAQRRLRKLKAKRGSRGKD